MGAPVATDGERILKSGSGYHGRGVPADLLPHPPAETHLYFSIFSFYL